jgi:uncharacterized SAM-binding protein YcdF (DUF218 family)
VRRGSRVVGVVAVVGALLAAGAILAARGAGRWLVVDDPVERAVAIAVLGGGFPFRAIEAASLYRQGWAGEVWVPRSGDPGREAALIRLGFEPSHEHDSSVGVLRAQGVGPGAIHVLPGLAQSTAQELRLVAVELGRRGGGSVILVTSKPHSRRVRATWRLVAGRTLRAVVRYAPEEPFDTRWWRNSHDALAVSREMLGLVNVWLGLPLQPDDAGSGRE